ncbi:hypothetical protein QJQ45_023420 [Haematococcus lacustris]|nr:hypothetical protein QJQ45_023420 [Haematococcus lacustris]
MKDIKRAPVMRRKESLRVDVKSTLTASAISLVTPTVPVSLFHTLTCYERRNPMLLHEVQGMVGVEARQQHMRSPSHQACQGRGYGPDMEKRGQVQVGVGLTVADCSQLGQGGVVQGGVSQGNSLGLACSGAEARQDASCEQFIELLALEAHPDQTLHAVLFENVDNAKQLRAQLDAGELPCSAALINACAVPHLSLLQSAAHKALHSKATAALHTKNLHTELVYNLSSSKHIGESLRRFGVGDDSRSLLLACFDTSKERWFKLTDKELALPGGLVDAMLTRIALREAEK